METTVTRKTTAEMPKKKMSRTMQYALTHKWMIELVSPELQAQCKSYKNGEKVLNP